MRESVKSDQELPVGSNPSQMRNRCKIHRVIAGLAQARPGDLDQDGTVHDYPDGRTSPAMTKRGGHELCSCYFNRG
jgi:hypothetical protein